MTERGRLESALERALTDDALSRRRVLGRGATLGLMVAGLAGCGIEGSASQTLASLQDEASSTRHPKAPIGDWTFSNWPLYIDKSVLKTFDKRYGGHVKYIEEINDNSQFFGKVRQQLAEGVPIGRDIVVLTDYMAAKWVRSGYVTPFDARNLPNKKHLVPNLRSVPYDPKRQFTLPWQSGAVGLGYDIRQTGGELKSFDVLFDPKYKGKISMLAEQYDSAGTVLLQQGKNPTKASVDDQLQAIEKLDKANQAGQFRRFTGNDYTTDLTKGNVAIALAYSGDLVQLQSDNKNLRFSYPDEGAMLFTDNMMLPAKVQHPYAAETMMNFVYEPKIAATICAYVNYISPVDGVRAILEKTNPDIASNELIFPPDEVRKKLYNYPNFSTAQEQTLNQAMAKVTGA